jgi:hypothetical protein
LGANSNWQDFKNHTSLSQKYFKKTIIKNSHFLCTWNMFKVWFLISNPTLFWLNQLQL